MGFKQEMAKGHGAGFIALGGMIISVATGYIGHFSAPALAAYGIGCLLVMWLIYTRESEIKSAADQQEQATKERLSAEFDAQNQQAQEARVSFESAQKELADIIRLMPPAHTMKDFSEQYGALRSQLRTMQIRILKDPSEANKQKVLASVPDMIRIGLEAMCRLVQRYQPHADENDISANLMLYHTKEDVEKNPALKDFVNEHIAFVPIPDAPIQNLKGVLVLTKELSASTVTNEATDPDPEAQNLVLPVPNTALFRNGKNKAYRYFVPVAPRAFAEGLEFHANIDVLTRESFYKDDYIDKNVRDDLMQYFQTKKEQRKIGSIISVALGKSFLNEDENAVHWGVINLHSTGNSAMSEDMVSSFVHVSRPILEFLKDILVIYTELNE